MASGSELFVPCHLCGISGIPATKLHRHIELFHSTSSGSSRNSRYSCIFCEFYTTSQSLLQSHINAKHPEQYACPMCELMFSSTSGVEAHMAESHAEDLESNVPKKFKMDVDEDDAVDEVSSHLSMNVDYEDIKKIDSDNTPSNMDVGANNDDEIVPDHSQLKCDRTTSETAGSARHQTLLAAAHLSLPEDITFATDAGSYAELSDLRQLDTSLRLNDCPSGEFTECDKEHDLDDLDDSIIVIGESITQECASVSGSLSDEESNLLEILGTTVKEGYPVDEDILHSTDVTTTHTNSVTNLSAHETADPVVDLTTNPTTDLVTDFPASITKDPAIDPASNQSTDFTAYHAKGARPKVRVNKPENSSTTGTTKDSEILSLTKKQCDAADSTNSTKNKSQTVIRAESKPDSTYICPLCSFKTESEGDIQHHINQKHMLDEADHENASLDHNELAQYSCPFCAKGFDTPRDLFQHIHNRHPEGEVDGGSSHQSSDWLQAPGSQVEVPSTSEAKQEKAEDSFECPVCGVVLEDRNEITLAAHVNEHFQSSLSPVAPKEQHVPQPRSLTEPAQWAPVTYDVDRLLAMKTIHTQLSPLVCQTLQQLGIHGNMSCPYGRKKEKQPYADDYDKELHVPQTRSLTEATQQAPVTYDADWLLAMKTIHTQLSPQVCQTLQQLRIHGNMSCPYGRKKEKHPYADDCEKEAQKDMDHQMALKLQTEENKQQQEENKQFQHLQTQYGMDTTMSAKEQFDRDLECAMAKGRLTAGEYREWQIGQKQSSHSGVDNGSTQVAGILENLKQFYSTRGCPRNVRNVILCNSTHHFSGSYGDKGWGCGYRNFQMILSCLMNEQRYLQVLFNGKAKIPSVQKLQQLLEMAWQKGFDPQGCQQLGGKVVNTRKWIGATEVVAILSSLKIKCQLLDFGKPSGPESTHPVMLDWVGAYYRSSEPFKPPLYLQHQGHSRCIVGIEELHNGNTNLIIFDPGVPKTRMEQFLGNINYNLLQCVRKTINAFRSQQYQIVAITGILSDAEFERSKLIRSTKLT